MKTRIRILLTLALVLAASMLLLSGALAETNITSAALTVVVPEAGYTPDYIPNFVGTSHFYSASYNTNYIQNDVLWHDNTAGINLPVSTAVFECGHEYMVTIYLTADDGYQFTSSTTATVNGSTATASMFNKQLKVTYTFPKVPTPITSAALSIIVPEADYTPDYIPNFSSGNFHSASYNNSTYQNDVTWKDMTADSSMSVNSSTFQVGHVYRVTVYLTPDDDYYFAEDATATINGKSAEASVTGSGQLKVTYTFPKLVGTIESAALSIDAPKAGSAPDFTPSFDSSSHFHSADYSSWNFENDVCWKDITEDEYLSVTNGVFQAGHEYYVAIYLTADEDYAFADDATATVNGQAPTVVGVNSTGQLRVEYTFSKLNIPIESAAVTITAPAIGAAADYSPVLPSGAHYYSSGYSSDIFKNDVLWKDTITGNYVSPASGTFESGAEYTVRVYLTAEDGYEFTDETTATLNGNAAAPYLYEEEGVVQLVVPYTFPKLSQDGWVQTGDKWQYFKDGAALTSWQKIGGIWYYFDASGIMQTSWQKIGGKWYYFKANGAMVTGWQKIGGVYYYFNASGAMVTGWQKIGGVYYYFNASGAMQTGWQKIGGKYYYFNASGAMQTGWQKIGGKYYYFNASGAMVTGWQKIGGVYYYFNASGAMVTGWQKIGGIWYYFNASGAMQTGWQKIGTSWYYFKESGAMVTGEYVIGGVTHVFDSNGVWQGTK